MAQCCGKSDGGDDKDGSCGKSQIEKLEKPMEDQCRRTLGKDIVVQVDGMDCAGCAIAVKDVVIVIPGILKCEASFLTSRLSIQFDEASANVSAITETIKQAGYHCKVLANQSLQSDETNRSRDSQCRIARNRFLYSTPFSVVIVICTDIIPYFHKSTILDRVFIGSLSSGDCAVLILSSLLLFYFNDATFKLFRDLRTGRTSVNTLSSLGILLAFSYSSIILFTRCFTLTERQETFFGTFAELSSFVLLGRWLEALATYYTASTSDTLLKSLPRTVTVCDESGSRSIDVVDLQINDIVFADLGVPFAADGIIVSGESEVDESLFTGNFMPILKRSGDYVYAGTNNLNGQLLYRVRESGQNTQISRLGRSVDEAQGSKAQLQLFADRLAFFFAPVILGLALATFLLWMRLDISRYARYLSHTAGSGDRWMTSLKMTIAVLVVSCPCALTVATPAAVMTGVRVGVENGLLIKGAAVLEDMQHITDIVFDKTGTLTQGKMGVDMVQLIEPWSRQDKTRVFWSLVLAAESAMREEHPIRKALVQYASSIVSSSLADDACSELVSLPGQGLSCQVSVCNVSHRILIGNEALLQKYQVLPVSDQQSRLTIQDNDGKTSIYVAIDGDLAGIVFLHDSVKSDAAMTIHMLKDLNITPWMLTGDSLSSALPLAQLLGIEQSNVHAACTITQKATIISGIRALGKHVIMVGDGINDGPALLKANVGISISGASDLATESSDIILLRRDSLCDVVAALHLAKAINWRIKLNLDCAFAWTLTGIPFAMGLFLPLGIYLPPAIAGCGMAFSCACITASSLWLKRWKRPATMLSEDERQDMVAEKEVSRRERGWFSRQRYLALEVV